MAKCMYCSEKHDRKGKYCSDVCKQRDYRRRTVTPTVTESNRNITVEAKSVTVDLTVTNPCKYCGKQLDYAILECCYKCATSRPDQPVSPANAAGHILSSRPALEFTGKMTVMERLFYLPGQTNFINLHGRACYGVY